jgi:SpoVK/Ycf46/Vps4 family AAA+-type ATPase
MLGALASGVSSVFVLHGNTHDLVPTGGDPRGAPDRYASLPAFMAEQMFARYDLVLHYDVAHGLRVFAGGNAKRHQAMFQLAAAEKLSRDDVPREPAATFAALDAFLQRIVMREPERRPRVAILVEHSSFLFPRADAGQLSYGAGSMLVTLLGWAQSPHLKPLDVAIVLVEERRADLSDRVTSHPQVTSLEVAMPSTAEREAYVATLARDVAPGHDLGATPAAIADQTAGLTLTSLRALLLPLLRGRERLTPETLKPLKKSLIEQQCQGLLEFIEPRWGLDTVVGLEAAKARLRDDARLLALGAHDCLPMGYLICGPVGTGKSFLMQCAAGELGIPCVMLRNFRSKYVGETEGNLERILTVLRALGPVLIVIDEADAAIGDRDQENDPTASRTFAMIATQMADTRYRGRLLWALLTARPDLLPIDIKRQGRAEVHVPLFYPAQVPELRAMFVAMARKVGTRLAPESVPELPAAGDLSGSDVEGMVTRALRIAYLGGRTAIEREDLEQVLANFLPSTQGLERRMQELAAILECTDRQFLPAWAVEQLDGPEGRAGIQRQFAALRMQLEGR